MPEDTWTAVDRYLDGKLSLSDVILEDVLQANAAAGLPAIDVSPAQGKFLHLFARMIRAERILEVGTLGGYSTICLARALPASGSLVTLEAEAKHAAVARRNFAAAGVADRIDLRLGRALDTLPALAAEERGAFDLVFIDADKPSNTEYFEWALRLTRPGSVIVVDNVIRKGAVVDPASGDERVEGVRRFFDRVAKEPRVSATALQTVGIKGYDGFTLLVVS